MVTNGKPIEEMTASELISHLERQEEARADAELRALLAEAGARLREIAENTTPRPAPLMRSTMTPLEKSRFIRSHPDGPEAGAAAYMSLPWA